MRSRSDRFAGTVDFHEEGWGTAASLLLPAADFRAELDVASASDPGAFPRSGPSLTFEGMFRTDGGSCTRSVRLDAALANHGTLLVGLFHAEGSCLEGGAAAGAFSFRRER